MDDLGEAHRRSGMRKLLHVDKRPDSDFSEAERIACGHAGLILVGYTTVFLSPLGRTYLRLVFPDEVTDG